MGALANLGFLLSDQTVGNHEPAIAVRFVRGAAGTTIFLTIRVEDWVVDLELLENARQAGYTTKVLFISTEDPNLNVGRVLLRMSQNGQGVPLSTIPESYEEAMRSLPEARKHADGGAQYMCSSSRC
jgi:hypothetical protein